MGSSFRHPIIQQLLWAAFLLPSISAFVNPIPNLANRGSSQLCPSDEHAFLYASKGGHNEKPPNQKKRYKFGDITQSLVTRFTKKKDYVFGDMSRALDQSAKKKVSELCGKDQYEFGDLSKYIDSKVKDQVNDFTKKDRYKFGDIAEEILNRIKNRDYTLEDIIILLKILLAFGAGLTPVAQFLPAKLLIEALDVSIAGDLGSRLIEEITKELDRRMKMAFTGSPDYQLGDLSKKAILKYIGKDEYTFGDITKFVMDSVEERTDNERKDQQLDSTQNVTVSEPKPPKQRSILDNDDSDLIAQELQEWDNRFIADLLTKETNNSVSINNTNSTSTKP